MIITLLLVKNHIQNIMMRTAVCTEWTILHVSKWKQFKYAESGAHGLIA